MKIKKFFKSQAGFTLIELLVVIGIIAVLATIGTISFGSASAKARDAKRSADIRTLQSGLEIYNSNIGNYPKSGAVIVWGTFLTSLGVSNLQPPQSVEDYCYFADANGTAYALAATDMEKDIPDTSSATAVTGPPALVFTSASKGGAACLDQGGVALACVGGAATAPNDYCIRGGI